MKWYFQNVRHELWDYNLPPAPGLIDITVNGKKIQALAQVGKSGYMYILDRVTGKPVFGVDETSGGQERRPRRSQFPDAADSGEASADFARQLHQGRHRHPGRHHAGALQGLP